MRLVLGAMVLALTACADGPDVANAPRLGPAIVVAAGQAAVGEDIAAYVRILNPSATADRLVSVSCTCGNSVEIHNSSSTGMHVLPHLDLPAGAATEIKPGGPNHLMIMGMKPALNPGQTVRMTLTFASGARAEADFLGVANSREGWVAEAAKAGGTG